MDPRTREPDPDTIDLLARCAETRRRSAELAKHARQDLDDCVRFAKAQGHSYSQIQKATGLSLGAVQRIVK